MFPAHDRDICLINKIFIANSSQPEHFLRLRIAQVIAPADVSLAVHVDTHTSFDVPEIDTVREVLSKTLKDRSASRFHDA